MLVFDGVFGNGIMRGVWSEDGDGAARGKSINGSLVGVGVGGGVVWEGGERDVDVVISF